MKYSGARYLLENSDGWHLRPMFNFLLPGKIRELNLPECALYGVDIMMSPLLRKPFCQAKIRNLHKIELRFFPYENLLVKIQDFYLTNLGFKLLSQENIGSLDVPVNDSALAAFVKVMQAPSNPYCDLIPHCPI